MSEKLLTEAFGTEEERTDDSVKRYELYGGKIVLYFDAEPHEYFRLSEHGGRIVVPGVTTVVHVLDKPALVPWAAKKTVEYIREHLELHRTYTIEELDVLLLDAKNHYNDIKEDAAEVGHEAHNWIEQYIKACIAGDEGLRQYFLRSMPTDERAANGCRAALDWMEKHQVVWTDTERKVYSIKHNISGTCDGICRMSACGDPQCCGEWSFEHNDDGTVKRGELLPATFKDVLAVADWKTSNGIWPEYRYQTAIYTEAINEERADELGERIEWRTICRLGKEDAEFETVLLPPDTLARDFELGLGCLTIYNLIEDGKSDYRAHREKVKAAGKITREETKMAERIEKERAKAEKKAERDADKEAERMLKLQAAEQRLADRAAKANEKAAAKAEKDAAKAVKKTRNESVLSEAFD